MKKLKIMIIIVILIIIGLIYSLLILSNNAEEKLNDNYNIIDNSIINDNIIDNDIIDENIFFDDTVINLDEVQISEGEEIIIINPNMQPVTNSTKFYTISNCIQQYFNLIVKKSSTELLSILDKDYIRLKEIVEENVFDNVHQLTVTSSFTALEMKMLEGENTEKYLVYGTILDIDESGIGEDVFFIVDLGRHTHTFSITPLIDTNYSNMKQMELKNEDIEIEKNEYNSFSYYRISDEELIRKYISNFKINAMYNTRESYNLLDKQYREKRFNSIDEYEKYIEENIDIIRGSVLELYRVTEENGVTIYDYIDTDKRHYIFKETAIMQYTVLLDNYTILPTNFNEYNEQEKVNFYIDQIIDMINYKDYNAIYNKLNTVFRNNNFSSILDLEQYLKNNTYDINEIKIENIQQNDDYYICTCSLINSINNEKSKKINIIIKLIDSNNFEMSFNFEQ